jgi:hypothetical protein
MTPSADIVWVEVEKQCKCDGGVTKAVCEILHLPIRYSQPLLRSLGLLTHTLLSLPGRLVFGSGAGDGSSGTAWFGALVEMSFACCMLLACDTID